MDRYIGANYSNICQPSIMTETLEKSPDLEIPTIITDTGVESPNMDAEITYL